MSEVYATDVQQVLEQAYGERVILASAVNGDEWVAVTQDGDPLPLLVADDLGEMMRRALRRWHQESGVGAALDRFAERGCRLSYRVDGEFVRVTIKRNEFETTVGATNPRGLSARLAIAERHLDSHEDRDFGPQPPLPPLR